MSRRRIILKMIMKSIITIIIMPFSLCSHSWQLIIPTAAIDLITRKCSFPPRKDNYTYRMVAKCIYLHRNAYERIRGHSAVTKATYLQRVTEIYGRIRSSERERTRIDLEVRNTSPYLIFLNLYAYMYSNTYIHACIHTYIHTHTHIYIDPS